MKELPCEDIRRVIGGRRLLPEPRSLRGRPPEARAVAAAVCTGVSTDSRSVRPGDLFVAIRGERFDGHDYLVQALGQGAAAAIVRDGYWPPPGLSHPPGGIIAVKDPTAALAVLAAYHRGLCPAKVVAVTGSNGKTTVKRMIHHILSRRLTGTCSPKSFNNHIGVPLTLLGAGPADDYVVCEVGSNAPGEVAALGRICRPHVAVITSIGPTHLERLLSIEGVAIEKASLLGELAEGGVGVVCGPAGPSLWHGRLAHEWHGHPGHESQVRPAPGSSCSSCSSSSSSSSSVSAAASEEETHGQDARDTHGRDAHATTEALEKALRGQGRPVIRFGEHESCEVRLTQYEPTPGGCRFEVNGRFQVDLPAPGRHNALNALAAMTVAHRFGMSLQEAGEALADFAGTEMRLQAVSLGSLTLLNDAYNANPASVAAAADVLAEQKAPRRVFVAGDMLELGEDSRQWHLAVGRQIARRGVELVVGVGALGRYVAEGARQGGAEAHQIASVEEAGLELPRLLRDGDVVLVKGSRGMAMERLVGPIRSAFDPPWVFPAADAPPPPADAKGRTP